MLCALFGSLKLLSLLQQSRGKHACSEGVCQTPRGLGIYYGEQSNGKQRIRIYVGPTVEFNPVIQ